MSVAAAISANGVQSSPYFNTFHPDELDPITDALVNAEAIEDVVITRQSLGGGGDLALRLAMDADPVETMARIMIRRHEQGYETTRDFLVVLGFTREQVAAFGPDARRRALNRLVAVRHGDGEQALEDAAMLGCLASVHAGSEG